MCSGGLARIPGTGLGVTMFCRGCGSQMAVVRRSKEGQKDYLWYACPKASCQQEILVVRTGACPGQNAATSSGRAQ